MMKYKDEKSQIEEMKLIVRDYFEEIFKFYKQIELWQFYKIHTPETKTLRIGNYNTAEEVINAMNVMHAFEKNFEEPFDYIWRPVEKETNILLLDFDKYQQRNLYREKAYMNVETSPGHYHTYIVMNRPVEATEYLKIARFMAQKAGADKMAVDLRHGRRIPGLFNNKYFSENYKDKIMIYFTTNANYEVLNTNNVLQAIQEDQEKQQKILTISSNPIQHKENIFTWEQFRQRSGETDYSKVDFAYCLYLIKNGFTTGEIYSILLQNSPDLIKRHPKVNSYLKRTLDKAMEVMSNVQER